MQRFKTLLLREWMQHRTAWMVMAAAPFVLLLLIVVFGSWRINADRFTPLQEADGRLSPLGLAVLAIGATTYLTLFLVWMANLLQTPGLARRDQQDRSIEFWLSLPAGHAQSLGATLLMHLWLVPIAAMAAGLAGGMLVAIVLVLKVSGFSTLLALPGLAILAAALAGLASTAFGLVLATLWLSPLILGAMAASAWLKRWGLVAVIAALLIGHMLLAKVYGVTVIGDTVQTWMSQANAALLGQGGNSLLPGAENIADLERALHAFPQWELHSASIALGQLASPLFLLALLIAAASFGLLVLRRQRGA
jgi:hypothetical protein